MTVACLMYNTLQAAGASPACPSSPSERSARQFFDMPATSAVTLWRIIFSLGRGRPIRS